MRPEVDDLVAVLTPEEFLGVGQWYEDFAQTTDAEVQGLLERAGGQPKPTQPEPQSQREN
jgi:predicted phosphoribosyltransferase